MKRHLLTTKRVFGQEGTALFMVLAVMSVFLILGLSALAIVGSETAQTTKGRTFNNAIHVAEAGINNYIWHLNKDPNYAENETHPAQGQDGDNNDRWANYEDGRYHLEITPASNSSDGRTITIQSSGRVADNPDDPETERTIKVEVRRKSFLDYLYLTNSEYVDGYEGNSRYRIWWITGDVVRGRAHSNGNIHIAGDPVFEKKVTTAGQIVYYPGRSNNPDFQEGYEENVESLTLPVGNAELRTQAQDDGYYYVGRTVITLNASGSLDIQNSNSQSTGPRGRGVFLPDNGVIYVDGDVYIEGTLSGKLTVGANNNVYINDNDNDGDADLVYRNQGNSSNDMLGLVANNFVYVRHDPPRHQAPYNIEINAAILALNHSFGLQNYSRGQVRGTLTVKGAIVQKFRGPVGTFSGRSGTRRTGYLKDYWYDSRMEFQQPPYFLGPVNASFEQISWQEIQR